MDDLPFEKEIRNITSDHPAERDQMVEEAKRLLGKSNSFFMVVFLRESDEIVHEHVMMVAGPGVTALELLVSSAEHIVKLTKKEADRE